MFIYFNCLLNHSLDTKCGLLSSPQSCKFPLAYLLNNIVPHGINWIFHSLLYLVHSVASWWAIFRVSFIKGPQGILWSILSNNSGHNKGACDSAFLSPWIMNFFFLSDLCKRSGGMWADIFDLSRSVSHPFLKRLFIHRSVTGHVNYTGALSGAFVVLSCSCASVQCRLLMQRDLELVLRSSYLECSREMKFL